MDIQIRTYQQEDLSQMISIWNEVVMKGNAFPQQEPLTKISAASFFVGQSAAAVAVEGTAVAGLYILHPNNIGRCGHIANASYAVSAVHRGKNIGEQLVLHSLTMAKQLHFRILQFNAVVNSNEAAIKLYQKLGFISLGSIPGGFLNSENQYEDITLFYYLL